MVRLRTVPFRLYFFREMDCKILISIKARRRNCDLIRHGNQDVKKVKGKLCYALQGGKQSLSLIHSSRKKNGKKGRNFSSRFAHREFSPYRSTFLIYSDSLGQFWRDKIWASQNEKGRFRLSRIRGRSLKNFEISPCSYDLFNLWQPCPKRAPKSPVAEEDIKRATWYRWRALQGPRVLQLDSLGS